MESALFVKIPLPELFTSCVAGLWLTFLGYISNYDRSRRGLAMKPIGYSFSLYALTFCIPK